MSFTVWKSESPSVAIVDLAQQSCRDSLRPPDRQPVPLQVLAQHVGGVTRAQETGTVRNVLGSTGKCSAWSEGEGRVRLTSSRAPRINSSPVSLISMHGGWAGTVNNFGHFQFKVWSAPHILLIIITLFKCTVQVPRDPHLLQI